MALMLMDELDRVLADDEYREFKPAFLADVTGLCGSGGKIEMAESLRQVTAAVA